MSDGRPGQEVCKCKVKRGKGRKSGSRGPRAEATRSQLAKLGLRARAALDEGHGMERDKPGLVQCPCWWEMGNPDCEAWASLVLQVSLRHPPLPQVQCLGLTGLLYRTY